ncbi:rho GTPase-activating protein 26-like isoform X1 [Amphibalanus amphitrite]|uniref:rho GTPase-activating protein 26-like isoform X1 n=1 Tax=Amphibalanus amphitrite TaxID=1232801 RepID=UPI001C92235E|nr:rho GTPase-activating protein 26-like isoform X1 [Amphibalanus amphitrite]
MGRSGLLPLEPTECLLDSPYFREKLHAYEKELENTSTFIKGLTKNIKELLDAAKHLSQCQQTIATSLEKFHFSYIGGAQTDDEIVISGSLKEFGKLIHQIEEERQRVLDHGYLQIIGALDNFRRQHIGGARDGRKKFEKQTQKFCTALDRYLNLSAKKPEEQTLREDALLEQEQRQFDQASLDYVCLLQEVQQRKKFEFVETLLSFMYGWLTFYHQGHELAKDSERSMTDLQARLQKTRDEFVATRTEVESLKNRTLEVRQTKSLDVGSMDKMYTRQGYLHLLEKKAFGTTWTKHYCMYDKKSRNFTLIPYNQITGKLTSTDQMKLKSCVRRMSDTIDRRFCFDVTAEERDGQVYTLQALSEDDRRLWMDAMDGKEPTYARFEHLERRTDHTSLDSSGLFFVSRCLAQLEDRGLQDQGLYRVVGVSSKVNRLVQLGLSRTKFEQVDLASPQEWENKTLTSAVKTYLRNLPEPLMTFRLHSEFMNAAKTDKKEVRVAKVLSLVSKLPKLNYQLLKLLIHHLQKVSNKSERNLMSISNLAVCFGPTLLRPEEDTMAAIIDIKFCNTVVETLIRNYDAIFCGGAVEGEQEPNGRSVSNGPAPATREPPAKPVLSASARLEPRSVPPALEHAARPSTPELGRAGLERALARSAASHQPPAGARRVARSSSPEGVRPARLASSPPDLGRAARTVRLEGPAGASRRHQSGSDGSGGRPRSHHVTSTLVTSDLEPPERASPSNHSLSSSNESLSSRSSRDLQSAGPSTSSPYARGKLRVRCPPSYRSQPDLSVSVPVSSCGPSGSVAPSHHKVGRVRTLYACVGENESELSFEPNQIITNVRPSREPGWLEGTLNGQLGLLPDNYVEFLP